MESFYLVPINQWTPGWFNGGWRERELVAGWRFGELEQIFFCSIWVSKWKVKSRSDINATQTCFIGGSQSHLSGSLFVTKSVSAVWIV